MLTLTLDAKVDDNGFVTVQLPPQVAPGYHQIVIVVQETQVHKNNGIEGDAQTTQERTRDLPIHDVGPWPEHFSLRREDLYDD
ncbi:MAG: hypothetical protein KDE53_23605 [Caldilineaceae bacterium]|nr:hypothetical protein [Caldilineaceae bacterium]